MEPSFFELETIVSVNVDNSMLTDIFDWSDLRLAFLSDFEISQSTDIVAHCGSEIFVEQLFFQPSEKRC